LLNLKTNEMVKDIKYKIIPTKESFTNKLLFFEYDNCELREKKLFNYTLKNKFLELELKSNKQPLLENKTGIIKDSKYYTYYYSLTNLKTKGIIKWKNKLIDVQGKSWHDHQWMGNITKNIKWDWFSIMLDNNEEIVISRTKASDEDFKVYATKIDSKNKQKTTHKVTLTPKKKITLNKIEYVVDWQIKIPDWNLDLNAKAIHDKQQMEYKFLTYWEGPILIECLNTNTKKKIKGQGFLEMVH
jgi:predicted secreted hydrolase